MSQENVDVIRTAFDDWNRRDWGAEAQGWPEDDPVESREAQG